MGVGSPLPPYMGSDDEIQMLDTHGKCFYIWRHCIDLYSSVLIVVCLRVCLIVVRLHAVGGCLLVPGHLALK